MKTVFSTITLLLLFAAASYAQSEKFTAGILKNKALLDSAKTSEEFTNVAAAFERIGDAEKTQWLPYYYAALANIWKGFTDPKANKDEVADKADGLIAKAEALEHKSSEIYLLKSMSSTLHMIVDPANRWQQYGALISENMAAAKQIDSNNPRIYYWEGQNLFGTPPQFGGGKDKAKPLFEKSLQLFASSKPTEAIYPSWGQQATQQMLERCN